MRGYSIGVHDGHNSSACLYRDGEVLFAIQEERLTYEKNAYGPPVRSIQACLKFAGVEASEVDRVCLASLRHTPGRFRSTDQRHAFLRDASLRGLFRRVGLWYPYYGLSGSLGWRERLAYLGRLGFSPQQCGRYVHHACHAATAYYGLREDARTPYAVVTIDGFGDLDSSTVWVAENGALRQIARTPFTDSIGSIYGLVTGAMGFTPLEHEYKLMGMAPYASKKHTEPILARFRELLEVDKDALRLRRKTLLPSIALPRQLLRLIAGYRFDNVCAALQEFTEEILVDLVRAVVQKTGIRRVLCAGGVFMNVKANKRLMELPEIDYLAVYPSCGDETIAMGACYLDAVERGGQGAGDAIAPLGHYYLGPDISEEECRAAAEGSGHRVERHDDVEERVAELLAAGEIVARCKGRMEFGARALGNRSILADPSRPDAVRVINQMVKKRDFWMPFAPAVRLERMNDYFVNPKNLPSPYMMLTFDSRENFRELLAAVHNADLTARPQVVEERHNPEYYGLIRRFEERTGRGVILNTSFNLHGYPIVTGPQQALEVFDNSGLRYLNIGQYVVSKREPAAGH